MFDDGIPSEAGHPTGAASPPGVHRKAEAGSGSPVSPVSPVSPISPWSRLNLRRNPFGEPEPEEVARLVVAPEVPALIDRLRRPAEAVQFLGACGRGKTIRLRAIGRAFPRSPYLYLPEDGPLPGLPLTDDLRPAGPSLLLDEAQRLPRRRRRRLFRSIAARGASLALASHEDLAGELEAAGLTPRTVVIAGLDPERLAAVVDRRLGWARLGPGALPRPDTATCRALIEMHGDDLRAVLDHLYELYQDHLNRATDGGSPRWPSAS